MPMFRKPFLALFLSFMVTPAFAQTYRDDSLAVAEILKANGLDTVAVTSVTSTSGDRIYSLTLSEMGITVLPECVGKLDAMALLNVTNNRITKLPQSMGSLTGLQYAYLYDNSICELPSSFARLKKLTMVYLIRNRLTKWPSVFYHMPNLESIDVGGNNLTDIPDSISVCKTLKNLYINDNYLTRLPEGITTLDLEVVHVAGNALCNVSAGVAGWLDQHDYYKENSKWRTYQDCDNPFDSSIVRTLLIDNGMLSVPVDSVVIMENGHIVGIDLSNKRLAGFLASGSVRRPIVISDQLKYLKYLRSLNLADNNMDSLPEWFGILSQVESLDLSNNRLTALPYFMVGFRNVKTLDLSGNRINNVPLDVAQWADTYAPGWKGKQVGSSVDSRRSREKPDAVRMTLAGSSGHSVSIRVKFTETLPAEIALYSLSGRHMMTIAKERFAPGVYQFTPDNSRLPRGTYLVTLRSGNSVLDAAKFVQ
jgi:Leucine-rich repeat (LRR) protein